MTNVVSEPAFRLPASLWDTRAPYARFLEHHKRLNRFFRITRASYAIASEVAADLAGSGTIETLRPRLPGRPTECPTHHDFKHLAGSSCRTVGDFRTHLVESETSLHSAVVISTVSLFESYALCWAANMLLDAAATERLEGIRKWRELARDVFFKGRFPYGGVHDLLSRFPNILAELSTIAAAECDPRTRKPRERTGEFEGSALGHVELWRSLRNCLVHRHGIADAAFLRTHRRAWQLLRGDIRDVPPLVAETPIPLTPGLLSACLTVHERLAKAMRDWLRSFSEERRGHVFSPGPYRGALKPEEMPPIPPLLLLGEEAALIALVGRQPSPTTP